jgi:hypothetical protein
MDPVFLNFGTIAIPSGCASYAIPDLPLTGYLSNTGTGGPPCAYTGIFSLYFDGTVEVVAAVALSYAAGQWGLGVTLTITDSSVPTSYQIFTLWMLTSANECNPSGGYDLSIVDSQCGDISWPGANPSVSLPS